MPPRRRARSWKVNASTRCRPPGTSTKTRAQVTAECDAAKKAGKIVEGQCQYEMPTKATSTKTREQVKAECEAIKKASASLCRTMPDVSLVAGCHAAPRAY